MPYSISLRNFTKRVQITFGSDAKVIFYSLEYVDKSQETTFNILKKIFLGGLAHFELQYSSTKVSNMKNWPQFFVCTKFSAHENLPVESANCMQRRSCFVTPLGKIKIKKLWRNFKICDPYTHQGRSTYHFQADLIWCNSSFHIK